MLLTSGCVSQRVLLAIMGFLAITSAYTLRLVLSVAITEMVVKKTPGNSTHDSETCPADESADSPKEHTGEYTWSEETQGIILSSFFWGYIITHLPGGVLADIFGGKYVLSIGILLASFASLFTPLGVIYGGPTALICLRFIMGLGEGTTFPAMNGLMASWFPKTERGMLGAVVFGGCQFGTIINTLVSGLLLHYFHWPFVFYFWGIIGIVWFIFFIFLCYSDPKSHPFITPEEKAYLEEAMGSTKTTGVGKPPWKAILTSVPVIAMIIAQAGHDFGFYIMIIDLPKYMSDVLRFPILKNGLYSSLPYILMFIASVLTGFASDYFIKKGKMTVTRARVLFTAISAIGPAIFIVAASYAGCNRGLTVFFFTLSMGFMGAFYPSLKVNPMDLSPNYASTLMALSNGLGSLAGVIAPYLVGVMTPNHSLHEWRLVFWITFIILTLSTVVFIFCGTGEVQEWNDKKQGD